MSTSKEPLTGNQAPPPKPAPDRRVAQNFGGARQGPGMTWYNLTKGDVEKYRREHATAQEKEGSLWQRLTSRFRKPAQNG